MVRLIICPIFATTKNNGTLADRLGNGLQNRVEQFDSARYLKTKSSHSISDDCFSFSPLHEARRHPRAVLATFLNARSWTANVKTVRECICRSTASTETAKISFPRCTVTIKRENIVPALRGDDKKAKILFPRRAVTIKRRKYCCRHRLQQISVAQMNHSS